MLHNEPAVWDPHATMSTGKETSDSVAGEISFLLHADIQDILEGPNPLSDQVQSYSHWKSIVTQARTAKETDPLVMKVWVSLLR